MVYDFPGAAGITLVNMLMMSELCLEETLPSEHVKQHLVSYMEMINLK